MVALAFPQAGPGDEPEDAHGTSYDVPWQHQAWHPDPAREFERWLMYAGSAPQYRPPSSLSENLPPQLRQQLGMALAAQVDASVAAHQHSYQPPPVPFERFASMFSGVGGSFSPQVILLG